MDTTKKLEDTDPCPVQGKNHGRRMEKVSDRDLVWMYEQPWLKRKYPQVHDYIVRMASAIPDLILREEDRP